MGCALEFLPGLCTLLGRSVVNLSVQNVYTSWVLWGLVVFMNRLVGPGRLCDVFLPCDG